MTWRQGEADSTADAQALLAALAPAAGVDATCESYISSTLSSSPGALVQAADGTNTLCYHLPAAAAGDHREGNCAALPASTFHRFCRCGEDAPPSQPPPAPPPPAPPRFHTYWGGTVYFAELEYKQNEQNDVQYASRRDGGDVEAGDLVLYVPLAECTASGNAWLDRFATDYPYDAYVSEAADYGGYVLTEEGSGRLYTTINVPTEYLHCAFHARLNVTTDTATATATGTTTRRLSEPFIDWQFVPGQTLRIVAGKLQPVVIDPTSPSPSPPPSPNPPPPPPPPLPSADTNCRTLADKTINDFWADTTRLGDYWRLYTKAEMENGGAGLVLSGANVANPALHTHLVWRASLTFIDCESETRFTFGFPCEGGHFVTHEYVIPASSVAYTTPMLELDAQRGMCQDGRLAIRLFSVGNNMLGATPNNPHPDTGAGCQLTISGASMCDLGPVSLHEVSDEAGLECPLSGPHAEKYVRITNNRCGTAGSNVDGQNTFISLSEAIDALKGFHDAAGGAHLSDCQSIVYMPTVGGIKFRKFVLVKGTTLLSSTTDDVSYTLDCAPPPPPPSPSPSPPPPAAASPPPSPPLCDGDAATCVTGFHDRAEAERACAGQLGATCFALGDEASWHDSVLLDPNRGFSNCFAAGYLSMEQWECEGASTPGHPLELTQANGGKLMENPQRYQLHVTDPSAPNRHPWRCYQTNTHSNDDGVQLSQIRYRAGATSTTESCANTFTGFTAGCVCKRAHPTYKSCTCLSPPSSPPAPPAPNPPPFPPPQLIPLHVLPKHTCEGPGGWSYRYWNGNAARSACINAGCEDLAQLSMLNNPDYAYNGANADRGLSTATTQLCWAAWYRNDIGLSGGAMNVPIMAWHMQAKAAGCGNAGFNAWDRQQGRRRVHQLPAPPRDVPLAAAAAATAALPAAAAAAAAGAAALAARADRLRDGEQPVQRRRRRARLGQPDDRDRVPAVLPGLLRPHRDAQGRAPAPTGRGDPDGPEHGHALREHLRPHGAALWHLHALQGGLRPLRGGRRGVDQLAGRDERLHKRAGAGHVLLRDGARGAAVAALLAALAAHAPVAAAKPSGAAGAPVAARRAAAAAAAALPAAALLARREADLRHRDGHVRTPRGGPRRRRRRVRQRRRRVALLHPRDGHPRDARAGRLHQCAARGHGRRGDRGASLHRRRLVRRGGRRPVHGAHGSAVQRRAAPRGQVHRLLWVGIPATRTRCGPTSARSSPWAAR